MNSKQNKSVTPNQKTPLKRRSVSDKENDGMVICKISSGRKVEQMISDMRISACKTITNVKSSFGDMSHNLTTLNVRGPVLVPKMPDLKVILIVPGVPITVELKCQWAWLPASLKEMCNKMISKNKITYLVAERD